MPPTYDLVVKNVRVVRPNRTAVERQDIGIRDGRFACVAPEIRAEEGKATVDGRNRLAFPGVVDAHMHIGIYQPLAADAVTESKAAAMGGVTSSLNYLRTGQYYLNRGGPYAEFMPEAMRLADGNFWVDYGFHIAPIAASHIDEMDSLLTRWGVPSFKIFMFYGGYGLHGRSSSQNEFLMIGPDDRYDIAHFEFVMRGARRLMNAHPELADSISVSLHCELADILTAYTKLVERDASLTGLRAYSAARPPHSEGLAIWIASYLAYETECLNINLLHLSSRKAIEAALMMQDVFPHIRFKREVTVGHLLLDVDSECAVHAKVNPPIRPREDVEALWQAVLDRKVDWIVSDHACCSSEKKWSAADPTTSGWRRPASAAPSTCSRASFPKGRSAACPLRTWPSSSAGIPRSATDSGARATSPWASMPISCSSTRPNRLSCAPPIRRRSRVIRRSRGRSSPGA